MAAFSPPPPGFICCCLSLGGASGGPSGGGDPREVLEASLSAVLLALLEGGVDQSLLTPPLYVKKTRVSSLVALGIPDTDGLVLANQHLCAVG